MNRPRIPFDLASALTLVLLVGPAGACERGSGEVVRAAAPRPVIDTNCPEPSCLSDTCVTFNSATPFVRPAATALVPVDSTHYGCFAITKIQPGFYVALVQEGQNFHRSLSRDGVDWRAKGNVSGIARGNWNNMRCPDPIPDGVQGDMDMYFSTVVPGQGWQIAYARSNNFGRSWHSRSIVHGSKDPDRYLYQPSVVRFQNHYLMAYASVCKGSGMAEAEIHVAYSRDGQRWQAHAGNPVLTVGDCGQWDDGSVNRPRLLVDPDGVTLHLFYSGYGWVNGTVSSRCSKIGHAVSHNLGRDWCKTALPVLDRPAPGAAWDDNYYLTTSFTWEESESVLRMYYWGAGGQANGIGMAETQWPLPDPCP